MSWSICLVPSSVWVGEVWSKRGLKWLQECAFTCWRPTSLLCFLSNSAIGCKWGELAPFILLLYSYYSILQTKCYDFPLNFFNSCKNCIVSWRSQTLQIKTIDLALKQATTTTINKTKQTKDEMLKYTYKSGLKHWKRRGQGNHATPPISQRNRGFWNFGKQ